MFDVIAVGSATVDVFARTNFSELIKIFDSKGETDLVAYPVGAKLLLEELNFTTGGGATNAAVCLTNLGHKVACISKIGTGPSAEQVIRDLKKYRINTSMLVQGKGDRTGYSIILDSRANDRTILTFKGSNNDLDWRDIQKSKLKTKWFYFSTMLEKSFRTQEKLAEFAQKNKIKITFNASSYLAKKGPVFLKNILSKTDIFVLNKDEAKLLTKKESIKDLLKTISSYGPKIVIITDGKNPFYAYDGSCMYSGMPPKVKVVETTGAGDAFAASFLSGIIKKNDIGFALQLAATNAVSVIQHHGAKTKLLGYADSLKSMNHYKIKIKKDIL